MSIDFSLRRFPVTGALKDACGLPFACVVQPFAKVERASTGQDESVNVKDVSRCRECYAYINYYCGVEKFGWVCALCGAYNEHSLGRDARYIKASSRASCPELRKEVVELHVDLQADGVDDSDKASASEVQVEGSLGYVVLVDASAEPEAMELVKSAIEAAIEAVPSTSLFGIISFGKKLGLYDVRGGVPCVRCVTPAADSEAQHEDTVDLEEALPLDCLLVPVGQYKAELLSAIDSLDDLAANNGNKGSAEQGRSGSFSEAHMHPMRPFGVAVQSVLRYLSGFSAQQEYRQLSHLGASSSSTSGAAPAEQGTQALQCAGVRLINFLCGPPNYGPGSVLVRYTPPDDHDVTFMLPDVNPYIVYAPGSMQQQGDKPPKKSKIIRNPKAHAFYKELSSAAAALGVCIDTYAMGSGFMGLDVIEPLATLSGGCCYLYPTPEEAALPQDIYKRLSAPFAFLGLLRFRTSGQFKVGQGYGHLVPDSQYDNLHHIVTCTPQDTYVFDLEYSTPGGFNDHREVVPMLQLVFQYSILTPVPTPAAQQNGNTSHAAENGHTRYTVDRRLRILTQPVQVCDSGRHVYEAAAVDNVVAVIMHKVMKVAAEGSVQEAQLLLRDWLVNLVARYHLVMGLAHKRQTVMADVTFDAVSKLQSLPRLVYALIHSPLLSATPPPGTHPDMRAASQYLWGSLPPEELCRAIYPIMSSFEHPDKEAFSRHSLSRAALVTAGASIFLMDSYNSLIVYYVAGYSAAIPFPPPQQSLLRKIITQRKQQRRLTPQVKMLRAGVDDVQCFDNLLLEDAVESAGQGNGAAAGYVAFLSTIRSEAERYLQAVLGST